jgi:flagellum-specific peptidoglycan hydrolase FlgJ
MKTKNYIYLITETVLILLLVGLISYIKSKDNKSTSWEVSINDLETVYDIRTIHAVRKYILEVNPASKLSAIKLVKKCNEYGVDTKFVLAQGHLESHFCREGLSTKTKSVWNVLANDDHTQQHIIKIYYKSENDCIDDYLKLLKNNYLVDKKEVDLLNNFVDKHGRRFASDTNYEKKLTYLYNNLQNLLN